MGRGREAELEARRSRRKDDYFKPLSRTTRWIVSLHRHLPEVLRPRRNRWRPMSPCVSWSALSVRNRQASLQSTVAWTARVDGSRGYRATCQHTAAMASFQSRRPATHKYSAHRLERHMYTGSSSSGKGHMWQTHIAILTRTLCKTALSSDVHVMFPPPLRALGRRLDDANLPTWS